MYHTVILNIEYEVTTDTGNYVIQEVIIIIRMIIAVMPHHPFLGWCSKSFGWIDISSSTGPGHDWASLSQLTWSGVLGLRLNNRM